MNSLHLRLILGTSLVTTLVLALASGWLSGAVRATLYRQIDEALRAEGELFVSTVKWTPSGAEVEFKDFNLNDFGAEQPRAWLELRLPAGTLLYRSPSLGPDSLPPATPTGAGSADIAFSDHRVSTGQSTRLLHLAFLPRVDLEQEDPEDAAPPHGLPPPPRLQLSLARPTAAADAFMARFNFWLGMGALASIASAALLLAWIVWLSLRPLDQLAGAMAHLGPDRLSQRFAVSETPREMAPVVRGLNALLERIEGAVARERAFSVDVAHELRTPLAGLRSMLEVAGSRLREPREYERVMAESLLITTQMQGMIEKLFCLARLEADQAPGVPDWNDLIELLGRHWRALAALAAERHLAVDWEMTTLLYVHADTTLLDLAVRNVLENAVMHCDEGGRIVVTVEELQDKVRLAARNTGSRVAARDVSRITGRFVRGDAARATPNARAGLGLSLVEQAVQHLGGSWRVESEEGGEFRVEIALPHSPGPAPDPT
jgi:signal transduction histidine kinase